MDLIKFGNTTEPTKLENAQVVNGWKSLTWVERYRQAGEFKLIADVSTGMKDILPEGTIISHLETGDIMIVEDHAIKYNRNKEETDIVITGRGFESFLENRNVGSDINDPTTSGAGYYSISAAYIWIQAESLLKQHIYAANLAYHDNDAIPYVTVMTDVSGTGASEVRTWKEPGPELYSALINLLEIEDLGIKVIRPGAFSPLTAGSPNIAMVIHKGVDRTASVIFDYNNGDIKSADYLWSNRKLKNAAFVTGKWVSTRVNPTEVFYKRRMMHVEASDIDDGFTVAPTGTDLTNVVAAMQQRGIEALAQQKNINLTNAEVSSEYDFSSIFPYRTGFNIGDLITVRGDYGEQSVMRVMEFVETEDEENGYSRYPTLSLV